jgi:integrase
MPTAAKKTQTLTEKRVGNLTYYLKPNGLPVGYGLYWATRREGEEEKRYIYAKTPDHPNGIYCKTDQWLKGVQFVNALRVETARREESVKPNNLTIDNLLEHYIRHLEQKNRARGEYEPATAKNTRQVSDAHLRNVNDPALGFFGPIKADQLVHMPRKIAAYRDKRELELCAKTGKTADLVQYTIDKELGIIRAAYNRAVKSRMIPKSIVPSFDINKEHSTRGKRQTMFTDEQAETLIRELPAPVNLMLALDLRGGIRRKETTFLHRALVNWNQRLVTLKAQETKAGTQRTVGFPESIWPLVLEWEEKTKRDYSDADYLFHLDGKRMPERVIYDLFNETCERLGWHTPKFDQDGQHMRSKNGLIYDREPRWHDSRRNATTDSGQLPGVNDLTTQRVMGQNPQTQERYDQTNSAILHRDAADLRDRIKAGKVVVETPVVEVVPATAGKEINLEMKLTQLKQSFDKGLLPEAVYHAAVERVVASFV